MEWNFNSVNFRDAVMVLFLAGQESTATDTLQNCSRVVVFPNLFFPLRILVVFPCSHVAELRARPWAGLFITPRPGRLAERQAYGVEKMTVVDWA